MRFVFPILLTIITLLLVATLSFPSQKFANGTREGYSVDGWDSGLDTSLILPSLDTVIPHYFILIAVGLAMIASWLRAAKLLRVPVWIMLLFTFYVVVHTALSAWCIDSGREERKRMPTQIGDDQMTIQMPIQKKP